MTITTKTGDKGKSSWTTTKGKIEMWKDDPLLEVLGEIDGLQCALGVVRSMVTNKDINFMIKEVEIDLWEMSGFLAGYQKWDPSKRTRLMEVKIKQWERELPPIRKFVVPGETQLGARLHWCRAIARRGERRLVAYAKSLGAEAEKLGDVLVYFNRLSDYIFMLARVCDDTTVSRK